MDDNIFVLLIQDDSVGAASIRRALAPHGEGSIRLQCVESLRTALARIGGGGVDLIILDLSLEQDSHIDGLSGYKRIRETAPDVPVIVLYDEKDEGLALRAMRAGAVDYLARERCGPGLDRVIRSAIEQERKHVDPGNAPSRVSRRDGGVLAFMGAKGGVGATTVALNVASALARHGKVILLEVRPSFGTLFHYLQPYGNVRSIWSLLQDENKEIGPSEAASCVYPWKITNGLGVLFGPQTVEDCSDVEPDRLKALIKTLAGMASLVVVDLPTSLSASNRAIIENSSRLALVVERDPICVQSARMMSRAIESWEGSPQSIEVVLVNRSSLSAPMPFPEINAQLGRPALSVIPPAADACQSAQRAHSPVILFEPDSLVASSLVDLAEKCASFVEAPIMAR